MKRVFLLMVPALILFSCTQTEPLHPTEEEALIAFETYSDLATKASTSTNLNDYHDNFGIWSYKTPTDESQVGVMANYKVAYQTASSAYSSTNWQYAGVTGQELKYWDKNATYAFYAYAPQLTDAGITGGKISFAEKEYAATENLQTAFSTDQNTAAKFATDVDLMLATAITGYNTHKTTVESVALTFKHILSKVVLKVKKNIAPAITVTKIELVGVHGKGSYASDAWTVTDDAKTVAGAVGAMAQEATAGTDVYYSMEYLVMPAAETAIKLNVEYKIGEEVFKVKNAAVGNIAFAGGNCYVITATIGPAPIEFTVETTTAWTENEVTAPAVN